MQLAEPANRSAFNDNPRGAIGMQPLGRKAGLGSKAVEVCGSRLEARQHLFHCSLHVVKINGAAGV